MTTGIVYWWSFSISGNGVVSLTPKILARLNSFVSSPSVTAVTPAFHDKSSVFSTESAFLTTSVSFTVCANSV